MICQHTEVTCAKGSREAALQKAVPSHLDLYHPVHKDSTHVSTDVCLLLHVVRKHEFFLPKSQLSGTGQTSLTPNKSLLTLCRPLPGGQSLWAVSGPACSHSFPRQGCHPLDRHHPPLFPACIQRSPWHTLHWHRGHPAAPCQCPPLLVPAGMEQAVIRGRPCGCQSPHHGKAAAPLHPPFPTCPHHPAVPSLLLPRGGFLKEDSDALCFPPQLSITLAEVSPRPRALPGAPVPPVAATEQCCDGLGQCCSSGSLPSPQGVSVPAQTPASLAQDSLWALQEVLGEFSSLTWKGQEHKSLLREDQIS